MFAHLDHLVLLNDAVSALFEFQAVFVVMMAVLGVRSLLGITFDMFEGR